MSIFRTRYTKVGAAPGAVVQHPDAVPTHISAIVYDSNKYETHDNVQPADLLSLTKHDGVTWIQVQGLADHDKLREIADTFYIHRLAQADVIKVPQRPKVEDYDGHVFIVARYADLTPRGDLLIEQISIFIGDGFVLSYEETRADRLSIVRDHLQVTKGPIRHLGPDYLTYVILDTVIDSYFPVLDQLGHRLEELEDLILTRQADSSVLHELYRDKRLLLRLRQSVFPHHQVVMVKYLRDCSDHVEQLDDMVNTGREMVNDLMNTYLTNVNNHINDVMKVLTVITTVFIPMTFLVGVYGMNFENMPELDSQWGYPVLIGVMVTIFIGLMLGFRRIGWLDFDFKPPTAIDQTRDDQ